MCSSASSGTLVGTLAQSKSFALGRSLSFTPGSAAFELVEFVGGNKCLYLRHNGK